VAKTGKTQMSLIFTHSLVWWVPGCVPHGIRFVPLFPAVRPHSLFGTTSTLSKNSHVYMKVF
jgi:hypothetical protein